MNGITIGAGSGKHSPRDNEENMSMFFDFGTSGENLAMSEASSGGQGQEPVQRGGIRVSLACVPVS